MFVRKREFGIAGLALLAVLGAHVWIRWSGLLPGGFVMLAFALICILLSWMIGEFKRSKSSAGRKAPSRALPSGISLITQQGPQCVNPNDDNTITNAFTIDLEDYFQTEVASRTVPCEQWDQMPARVEFSTMRLLELLDENSTKSTVFVLGWVASKYPRLIREIARRGHEIGCHSFLHRPVSRLEPNAFYEDTRQAKQAIEEITGVALRGYRAPNFSLTPGTEWAHDILSELGFEYDSSVNPVRHTLYGNPGAPRHPYRLGNSGLMEIPIATLRVGKTNLPIGGGAYLRLLPYHYIQYGLEVMNSVERKPATVYVHPWEIDYYQPRLSRDFKSHVRQTWGTANMEDKLSRLLKAFKFAPISEVHAKAFKPAQPAFSAMPQRANLFVEVI